MKKKICVFGGAADRIEDRYKDDASFLGQMIGAHGYDLIFGGGDKGLMGACARGAKASGADVTGVIPDFMNKAGVLFQECTHVMITPTMAQRKQVMEEDADAFVAMPGGFGTFEELTEVITLKNLRQMDKPIVILNTSGFYNELLALFEQACAQRFIGKNGLKCYEVAGSAQIAIKILDAEFGKRRNG